MTLPAKSIYLMDETPVDTFEIFEALNLVKVFGAETSENEILSKGLADGSVLYGGSWDKPEYKKLVQNKTDLAITSGKLLPLSGETLTERKQTAPADAESLTAVEYRDRLYDLADRFAVLDIPMLIDRSADEADALAPGRLAAALRHPLRQRDDRRAHDPRNYLPGGLMHETHDKENLGASSGADAAFDRHVRLREHNSRSRRGRPPLRRLPRPKSLRRKTPPRLRLTRRSSKD